MAGSFETLHKVTRIGARIVERLMTLEFLSDASDGSVPNAEIENLTKYILEEIITIPGSGGETPAAYRVRIEDKDSGRILFLGETRSTSVPEAQGGYEYTGMAPAIDGTIVLKIVGTDGSTAIDAGNEKTLSVALRLKRK